MLLHAGTHRWKSLPLVLGIGTAVSFALFGVLAATRFPRPYGPWQDNTISQLGNRTLNPDGYVLYLAGCALAGIFGIAFFLSLNRWRTTRTPSQSRLFFLVQLLGVAGSFGLLMSGVFSENDYPQHHFWSGVIFNAYAAAALLAIPALWRFGRSNFGLIAFSGAAVAVVIAMFVFASVHWLEWLPAAMFLMFPILLAVFSEVPEHPLPDLPDQGSGGSRK
jgi:hypothetical membrane protein